MPLNSIPSTTTHDALKLKQERARTQAYVDVGFWGGAVPGNLPELAKLHDGGVFGFKCFLIDSGVDKFPPLAADEFAAVMAQTAHLGALLIVHAEVADVIEHMPPASGPHYETFLHSRPYDAEDRAIAQVIDAARTTGGRHTFCTCPAPTRSPNCTTLGRTGWTSPWRPARTT